MPWRPANLNLPKESLGLDPKIKHAFESWAQVLNQQLRETNNRVDSTNATLNRRIGTTNALLNFGTISANQAASTVVNLLGANQNQVASASPRTSVGSPHLIWSASVTGANTVTVRLANPTTGPITPNVVMWNIVCQ